MAYVEVSEYETIEDIIEAWLKACTGLERVFWSMYDHKRVRPYATINIVSDVAHGHEYTTEERTVTGAYSFLLVSDGEEELNSINGLTSDTVDGGWIGDITDLTLADTKEGSIKKNYFNHSSLAVDFNIYSDPVNESREVVRFNAWRVAKQLKNTSRFESNMSLLRDNNIGFSSLGPIIQREDFEEDKRIMVATVEGTFNILDHYTDVTTDFFTTVTDPVNTLSGE